MESDPGTPETSVPSPAGSRPHAGLDAALAVADAVLYEGYLLYPYRSSSGKNRVRWQFGVVAPRSWMAGREPPDGVAGSAESWWSQAECLLEAAPDARLEIRLRFLAPHPGDPTDADPPDSRPTGLDRADPGETRVVTDLAGLLAGERAVPVDGVPAACLRVGAERAAAPFPLHRLRLRIDNGADDVAPDAPRPVALRRSLVATHLLVGVDGGSFLSLVDPPEWARPAAEACRNVRLFPVLAGPPASTSTVLAAPIILYDHPQVAPESPGNLFDAAEIDEILSLRTLTLTEEEKAEARATDPRAAELVDRVDSMPAEVLARLHGAVRSLRPVRPADPPAAHVMVAGVPVGPGSRVRLRPRRRGSDAQDMFVAGRTATVEAVLDDVDGSRWLAVTVDDDPRPSVPGGPGRVRHFAPDELEPAPEPEPL